jgi:SH3 domain-containing YSC84-like protein 1
MGKGLGTIEAWVLSVPTIILSFVILAAVAPAPAVADDKMDASQLMERAKMTFDTFMTSQETEAFRGLLKDAKGIYIAPQVLRGAFIIGASGGSGVLFAKDQKTGKWTGPAFYTIGEGSFGFQAGGDASELILLAMTDRG